MRLMLFFDGRKAKRAWPVVRENIRPNVKPRKSNSPSGTLQIQLQLAHEHAQMVQRRFGIAPAAQDHEVIGIGDKASAKALLKAELLPPQHKPAHVKICQPTVPGETPNERS
jgi:hypothetical protein